MKQLKYPNIYNQTKTLDIHNCFAYDFVSDAGNNNIIVSGSQLLQDHINAHGLHHDQVQVIPAAL